MLVYSPGFLFLIPGAVMVALGLLTIVTVLAKLTIFGRQFYIHAEIAGSMLVIVGIEVIVLGLIARTYGFYFMGVRDPFLERMHRHFTLERGLIAGGVDRPRRARRRARRSSSTGSRRAPARSARARSPCSRRRSWSPASRSSSPPSCSRSSACAGRAEAPPAVTA